MRGRADSYEERDNCMRRQRTWSAGRCGGKVELLSCMIHTDFVGEYLQSLLKEDYPINTLKYYSAFLNPQMSRLTNALKLLESSSLRTNKSNLLSDPRSFRTIVCLLTLSHEPSFLASRRD